MLGRQTHRRGNNIPGVGQGEGEDARTGAQWTKLMEMADRETRAVRELHMGTSTWMAEEGSNIQGVGDGGGGMGKQQHAPSDRGGWGQGADNQVEGNVRCSIHDQQHAPSDGGGWGQDGSAERSTREGNRTQNPRCG